MNKMKEIDRKQEQRHEKIVEIEESVETARQLEDTVEAESQAIGSQDDNPQDDNPEYLIETENLPGGEDDDDDDDGYRPAHMLGEKPEDYNTAHYDDSYQSVQEGIEEQATQLQEEQKVQPASFDEQQEKFLEDTGQLPPKLGDYEEPARKQRKKLLKK